MAAPDAVSSGSDTFLFACQGEVSCGTGSPLQAHPHPAPSRNFSLFIRPLYHHLRHFSETLSGTYAVRWCFLTECVPNAAFVCTGTTMTVIKGLRRHILPRRSGGECGNNDEFIAPRSLGHANRGHLKVLWVRNPHPTLEKVADPLCESTCTTVRVQEISRWGKKYPVMGMLQVQILRPIKVRKSECDPREGAPIFKETRFIFSYNPIGRKSVQNVITAFHRSTEYDRIRLMGIVTDF